jgi:hypothetical protein
MMNNNLVVFYHIFQTKGWELTFNQQVFNLYVSGLYNELSSIYLCINGNLNLPFDLSKFVIHRNIRTIDEADTLKQMWRFSQQKTNFKILYIHTKGVSYHFDDRRKTADAWRLYMEYHTINKWKKCVELLDSYDCVGTKWQPMKTIIWNEELKIKYEKNVSDSTGCYDGNFWWVNSNYIKTLNADYPYMLDEELKKYNLSYEEKQKNIREHSQMWLGTKNPKYYSFETFYDDLYKTNILNKLESFQ